MSSNSSPDFSTMSENQESKIFDDTIFGSLKKKTLNDYDKVSLLHNSKLDDDFYFLGAEKFERGKF